ncbi:MAG: metallophosphoesterase, partial [Flavobacteriales bacterium]|nr:metallophosphoesterase [Flavobacteriales bacterium]
TSGVAWDNFTIIKTPMPAYVAPTVVRGPYLNSGTPSSMVVRWNTDTTTDSKIWYGTSVDTASMTSMINNSLDTSHIMSVTGLTANTKYYYAIGTTSEMFAGADNGHYFVTSPVVGTKQPIKIWAIGDFGEGNTNQGKVRDAFKDYTGDGHADVWLWLGDNAYDGGRYSEYQTAAFDMYPTIFPQTVLWPSLGNHDYGENQPIAPDGPGPYLELFTLPTAGEAGGLASGNELYYSFDYGNVHFISINSEAYTYTTNFPNVTLTHDSTMLAWIENDLASNTNTDWLVAYLHATPYANGTHTENYTGTDILKIVDGSVMRSVRDNIVPILENYGVDLVLAGHSHDYERSYLVYGNYGTGGPYPPDSTVVDAGTGRMAEGAPYQKFATGANANKGGVFCVVGCSAKIGSGPPDDGPLNHELMVFDDYRLGSLLIEVDDDQLDAYFIDTSGTAWDNFTIIKTFASSVPDLENKERSLKVYPNPFADQLTIEYTLDLEEEVSLTLLDLTGQQVYAIVDSKQSAGNYKYTIDAENTGLSKGVYLLQLKTEGSLVVQKTIRL